MTRPELRVFLDRWFCGCGSPEVATAALLRLLRLHPLYDPSHQRELQAWLPDEGVRYLLLYQLDRLELTEHGGTVDGAWLSETGEALRAALERESLDNFAALHAEHCACGHDTDDLSHSCT